MDYFSLWIGNFGVVPLLLLAFFLLAPALIFLLLRCDFVFIVFEPIIISLLNLFKVIFKSIDLPSAKKFVKINLLITITCCLATFVIPKSYADTYFLAQGEVKQFSIPNLKKFNIGNKDVIKHKHQVREQLLLLSGNKIGYSGLIIWKTNGEKQKHDIYVLSKRDYLKQIQLGHTLKELGQKVDVLGGMIYASGDIATNSQYFMIKSILKENKSLHINSKFTKEFRNSVFEDIYINLYEAGASYVECQAVGINIYCFYEGIEKRNPILELMNKKYLVEFKNYLPNQGLKNLRLKLKIIQVEYYNGHDYDWGLGGLNLSIEEILKFGSYAKGRQLKVKNFSGKITTLAEPELIVNLDEKNIIQVGSELPYNQINQESGVNNTIWKFAGLKINTTITNKGDRYNVHYESEFTKPSSSANQISGSKEKSSLYLKANRKAQIFKIGYKTVGENENTVPILDQIPLLKKIFRSSQSSSTYKEIIGVITLETMGED